MDHTSENLPPLQGERLWHRAFSQRVDAISIEKYAIPGLTLMENAGLALVALVHSALASHGGQVLILAGPGNNGGDALVAAWHLWQDGCTPTIICHFPQGRTVSASCAYQLKRLTDSGIPVVNYTSGFMLESHWSKPIIVDGLLGIGFRGKLTEDDPFATLLAEAAQLPDRYVIAVDVPSGCDADNWMQPSPPLVADVTLTFGGAKPVHRISPARSYCGDTSVIEIGFHPQAIIDAMLADSSCYRVIDTKGILATSPWNLLSPEASKFDRGHVLVIGGSPGKSGAPLMAALSALRTGCGWASVALPRSATGCGFVLPLEVTFEELFDQDGNIDGPSLYTFCKERKVRSVLIGPGLVVNPLGESALRALRRLNQEEQVFVTLDAGALHGVGQLLAQAPFVSSRTVATPHPGEWRRMLTAARPIVDERGDLSATFRDIGSWGVTLLYKSATPLVLDPDQRNEVSVVTTGGIELAKAGSGDVLAGMIAAHGALGCTAQYAAVRGYALLAHIAATLSQDGNKHALLPTDLIAGLVKYG